MVRVVVIAAAQVSAERMLRQNGGFLFQYRRNAPKGSPFAPHRRPPNCRRSPASAGDGYQADAARTAKRPFVLFAPTRWRPGSPLPGEWQENLAYGLFVAAPLVSFGLLMVFMRRVERR